MWTPPDDLTATPHLLSLGRLSEWVLAPGRGSIEAKMVNAGRCKRWWAGAGSTTFKMRLETSLASSALAFSREFRRDAGGAAAVVAAVLFPVLIGGMGLSAETGYWYMKHRKLQHAADTP